MSGPASSYPAFSSWMNFYDMFDLNQGTSMVLEESGPIQGAIWNAIVSVSESALVDARFILAIIMQEVSFFCFSSPSLVSRMNQILRERGSCN